MSLDPVSVSTFLVKCSGRAFLIGTPMLLLAITAFNPHFNPGYPILLCFVISILCVVASLAVKLLFILQLRIADLVFLVSLSGAVIGSIVRHILPIIRADNDFERIVSISLFIAIALLFISGGATWGVWFATVLNRQSTLHRIWLMGYCILLLLAVPAFFFSSLLGSPGWMTSVRVCIALFAYLAVLRMQVKERRQLVFKYELGLIPDPSLPKTNDRTTAGHQE